MSYNIQKDNQNHLQRFNKMPPHPSYIAGFIDGDGCIFIRKIKDGYQSGIQITQCRTNILQVIRYHFGGTITSNTNRNNKLFNILNKKDNYIYKYNVRNQYNLLIRSDEYQVILNYIKNNIIIKQIQINSLYEFNKIVNLQNKLKEKEELFNICNQNNLNHSVNNIIDVNKLNIEYIAGLFDAEGCLYISTDLKKYKISISQKNHPYILHKIKEFLGFGLVCSKNINYIINNKIDCLQFISLIKNNIIVKYNQAIAFETYLNTTDILIKENMYKICNEEKHSIEHFTDLNNSELGKEMFFETIKLKELKEKVLKELLLKQFYKEKSINMRANGNHNYGKSFTEETKKKMSTSIRDAKCGVTDDTIIAVRNMIKEGYKNIEIQQKLELPRHTVTKIKNGLLVLRTEAKIEKEVLTKEQQNINKRKIKLEEILTVIDMVINNKKPMEILDYLIEERNINNIEINITIDIIKNIKRNISQNKIPIYDFEVEKDKYNEYLNKINSYNKIYKQIHKQIHNQM